LNKHTKLLLERDHIIHDNGDDSRPEIVNCITWFVSKRISSSTLSRWHRKGLVEIISQGPGCEVEFGLVKK